ncbi:MAG: hypothetical protein V1897_01960 [Pseudomonadota bacterium]
MCEKLFTLHCCGRDARLYWCHLERTLRATRCHPASPRGRNDMGLAVGVGGAAETAHPVELASR